jgi:methionine synthase I (cobalamin-dependent)
MRCAGHRRYAEAGADVITTNTWALPALIGGGGTVERDLPREVDWFEAARGGVRVAREAIAGGPRRVRGRVFAQWRYRPGGRIRRG